ncbi:uncharacterized protein LOC100888867 [Strongylocentrotus purpuratus]|uniref:Uncharacterized protein n=1 Tax=Strongylocentrotus purpuratus TaxID=7668 RepID=A0A7M7SWH0_STRPU|nr:uncharacterized protein LOC100888867 [Strongylocentrotus purpuratus]XP_030836292.1 uncharacterized protein LOC100888867 [Strongylocentrotus purpuratus]
MVELVSIREVLSLPVDYPNDVEILFYDDDLYIIITHASNTSNPSICDEVHIYKFDNQTGQAELVLVQSAPDVQDVDFFIYDGLHYVVVAICGDGSTKSAGLFTYLWTVDQPTDSQTFFQVQRLKMSEPTAVETIIGGNTQFIVVVERSHAILNVEAAVMYEWKGGHMDEFAAFPKPNLVSIIPFCVFSRVFLGLASSASMYDEPITNSEILLYNLHLHQFETFQTITTYGVLDMDVFTFGSGFELEVFLLIANTYDEQGRTPKSFIYKYNENKFIPFQCLEIADIRGWYTILDENKGFVNLIIYTATTITFYEYDGWQFQESTLQFEPSSLAVPVCSISVIVSGYRANLVLASQSEQNETEMNLFKLQFAPVSILANYVELSESVCESSGTEYENITHTHTTIITKIPDLITVDGGEFDLSGNVSFLSGITAEDIVLNEIIIEDDVVLTNAEEEQLQRIINKMNTNANKITTMQNELPNTVLLNTTPQTITGLKTFASFEAVGDLSPSTLTVTSDLVNTDINIQDLYDEYIDKTSNVDISVSLLILGGIDVTGELTTTGTVDDVDMTEVVTLSGDHTITGVKTFTGQITANGDFDVSGTVDGVTLTPASVLQTSGAQTVTGTYTFSASITATENVVVTGTVDGVDLSELKDEAVYLDGSHDITGPMTFDGAVTMGDGLTVTAGNTVDGVDIEDLDAGILRLSVQQDVSAEYTFTSPLTVEGDITTEGTVDSLNFPYDVVLIDNPNMLNIAGPLKFANDVTLESLVLRDHINNINALEPYRNLDLLLTAATNTKNIQQVSGSVEFSTDIYLNDDTIINDRIDGVNLKTLVPKTVFNYGNQEITGVKTFAKDVDIQADLTVSLHIDTVDINDLDDNAIKLSSGDLSSIGDLDFSGNIEFQDEVTTNNAHTFGTSTTLSDLVTQGTTETIAGAKSFTAVTSSENVQVTSNINRVPIDRLYSEAVKLDSASEVTVSGSWQFSNDVNIGGTLSVTGDIDGIDLDNAVTISGAQTITSDTSFSQTVTASTSLSIGGDLVLSGDLNGEDIEDVESDTLKCSGAQVVTGSKTFESLTVRDDLVVSGTVGGVDVSDMNDNAVFTSGNQDIAGAKTFGASPTFTDVDFNDVVNGISVPGFFDTVLTQGTTQTVQGTVQTVDVAMEDNVIVSSTVNALVVEDMWTHSAKITDTEYTIPLEFSDVESEDDVTASGAVDGILISRDVAISDTADQVFTGAKTFQAATSFGADINVVLVNTIDILQLWNKVVKNVGNQDITAGKTFSNGITINGNLAVTGTVDGVDVSDLADRAVVTSDVNNAVQTITAPVTLSAVTAEMNVNYGGHLQTVDIQALDSSYFSRSASSQTIIGSKRYTGNVIIATGASITVNSLDLDGLLNTWDMDQLHEEVWMDDAVDTIYGVKTFQQCISIKGDLLVDGTVDGVDISDNVMVTNQVQLVTGFKAFTSDVAIDGQNLNFENSITIDGVDVSDWGGHAVLKASGYTITADLAFESIHFDEDVGVTGLCSGLNFSPRTFMTKSRDQTVTAIKTFQFGVLFSGNMDVTGTVQGADVQDIKTTSLLVSGEQTITGPLVLQTSPTFSDITTSALIDGEDVVELYLRTHSTPALDDFEDFLDDQCHLLDDMHDAFQNQAYILRYPELVQTIQTNGRGKMRGYYFDGVQWLFQAMGDPILDSTADNSCQDSFIYQWNDVNDRFQRFKTLKLAYIHDVAFFDHEGWLFMAVITSNVARGCEELNFLPLSLEPFRYNAYKLDVIPAAFEGITDRFILIIVWAPLVDQFFVYQRLAGVGSVSVDHYTDPQTSQPCLAIANHKAVVSGNVTSEVQSAVYCMEFVASGFNHNNVIDTLGAVKIHPFVYEGILHLAVANRLDTSKRTFMVESAIWGDFVKEVVIATTAAADVAVTEFHGTYFVAFANEFEGQLAFENYDVPVSIYTYVYDADGESQVDLWQELPAFRVKSLEFVVLHDQLFLVVINRTSTVNIFRYEGMQKFQVIHTIPLEGAMDVSIYPFKNDPEIIHMAAMAYGVRPTLFANAPVRTTNVDSIIFRFYFDGFKTDTTGCSRPFTDI